ncbi:MAG: heavy metal translocating P-type ATPase metal-binding domain-containing protein [Arenimonas sp.]
MNAVPRPLAASCAHCGEAQAVDAGEYCCAGCAAAAERIREAGLGDYYRLRSEAGTRVDPGRIDLSAWDREDLQRAHVSAKGDEREIRLALEGMRCAACAWLVDHALAKQPGVIEASANAASGRLRLRWRAADTSLSPLLLRLHALGYRAFLAGDEARARARRRERNALLLRLGVAALVSMQAMMFAEAAWLDSSGQMPAATRDLFRWLAVLLTTPVVFWCGMPILSGMRRELALARPGMDSLAGVSILLAWGASLLETLRGGPQVWFDAAAMFVLFLLLARVLERFARDRAGERLELLARAQPELAWRRRGEAWEQVPATELRIGDEVRVEADASVPADGELLDLQSEFDESLLSGESVPVPKQRGDAVLAGSLARLSGARIRVAAVGRATRLAQVQALVERAQEQRPKLARAADLAARVFVLVMFAAAIGSYFYWLPAGAGRAFPIALSVLVAACPCALALAVPATLSSAVDALARRGVLVPGVDAIERLGSIDTVLFDKTGTLTRGQPRWHEVELFGMRRELVLALAAGLEHDSRHPLAQAFALPAPAAFERRQLRPGLGVEGFRDGICYRLGRGDFAAGRSDDGDLWLGRDGEALARFAIQDELRADAAATIARLRTAGLHLQVASGDGRQAVAQTCRQLGIADWQARLLPAEKLAALRALQARGRRVLAVGDGINDAPLLAGADASIAIGGGSALAQRSADLLLTGERLSAIAEAVLIARRARRILRWNLAWAAAYNLVAISVAASGLIAPGWAALGMAGSSLGVTLNALRVGRIGQAKA